MMVLVKKLGWVIVGFLLFGVVLAQMFLAGLRYERLVYLRVVDGDTFWVRNTRDGSEWKVRLWAVDAPELGKCYGKQAKLVLEKQLESTKLTFERYGFDGYGRILAKVFVGEVDLQERLIRLGAVKADNSQKVHDDLKPAKAYFERLKVIEDAARKEGVGLWSGKCE